MGTLVDTVSFHPHLCTMRPQMIAILFLGLMACTAMANVPVLHPVHPKLLAIHPNLLAVLDRSGLTVPVEGLDDNNDGIPDKFDLNRDGKVDFGHLGFPFFGLHH